MDFKAIYSVVDADFKAVNDLIVRQMHTQVPFIEQVGRYIIDSGGKRLRPLVCLLAARALGYTGNQHLTIAAVVEFLHTATLLHDDVVDASNLRRGRATVNSVWGNAPSVLVGDFLISRAFQMVVGVGSMKILQILSDATNLIAEGEVLQLVNCRNPETSEDSYFRVIHYKTAKMFEAAAQSGAVLAGPTEAQELALANYAAAVGSAFQLVDDVLDYTGNAETMGKNVGDDLAEGKPTLPLIHAIRHAEPAKAQVIKDAIRHGGLDHLQEIVATVQECGALEYTLRRAREKVQDAKDQLDIIPASLHKDALLALADLAIHRDH
jgi:octaprenyl-diphosphate synthase